MIFCDDGLLKSEPREPLRVVICLSGKRKSGKDFVAAQLRADLVGLMREAGVTDAIRVDVVGISFSLKEEFARLHGLDADRLKSDGEDKEAVRREMVAYGERIRDAEPGYFCRSALSYVVHSSAQRSVHIIVISDCRRPTDLAFFRYAARHNFNPARLETTAPVYDSASIFGSVPPILVRIEAGEATRQARSFHFVAGIDDAPTECALDSVTDWDVQVRNDGDAALLSDSLRQIARLCAERITTQKLS